MAGVEGRSFRVGNWERVVVTNAGDPNVNYVNTLPETGGAQSAFKRPEREPVTGGTAWWISPIAARVIAGEGPN